MVYPVVCESWTIKKAKYLRVDAFELWCWRSLLRVPWTARRSNQSIVKEINPWIFIGSIDVRAEAPILWPLDVKSRLIWKDPDAGKDWGQEEKGATEDEMVGGHHQISRHEFEQTLGDSEGQGSLVCCSPWCCRETRQRLNNNKSLSLGHSRGFDFFPVVCNAMINVPIWKFWKWSFDVTA